MPRIISDDEAAKLNPVPMGKKHPVRAWIEKLKASENLLVNNEDFKWKGHSPKRIANEIERKTGKKFDVSKMQNKKGWVVKRLE